MAELDVSAMSDAMKSYHGGSRLTDLLKLMSPFLGRIRRGVHKGKNVPYPMITAAGQAALSGAFATANTNRTPATFDQFLMENPGKIFAIGGIERDVIDRAKDDESAYGDFKKETTAKFDLVMRELAHTLQRTENAVCGVISTIAEGGGQTTIVVEDFSNVSNLGPGANLVASATPAGALRDTGTVYPVVSVAHTTGTIVLTGTAATTSLWAVGDSLHREGSAPDGGSPIYSSGIQDWLVDGPTSTLFRTVDRSVLPDKLAGVHVTASTSQIREALSEITARIRANGGKPTLALANPLKFSELEMELDAFASHEKVPARFTTAKIGYDGIRVAGAGVIVPDPFTPYNKMPVLDEDTWAFLEIGGERQPRFRKYRNGDVLLDMENADAIKFQAEAKGDLACSNPGGNGLIHFS